MTTKEKSQIFLTLPYTEQDNYPQKILSGLGKATKRGIKKCSSCGVYNGTRSTMCKNKECGVILKNSEEKSKVDVDAVRLLTGTERQVYSVQVKDIGLNTRGFVQLPLLQSHNDKDSNIFSEVALCFVDSCQNSFDNSILKCHEEDQNDGNLLCDHIRSALKSQTTAAPIALENHVLHSLKVAEDVKAKLYLLATEKEGPLVQRVSKCVMAVKCQVTPKHPFGYLHFTFSKGKGCYENYHCSCTEFMVSGLDKSKSKIGYKCIHYYACIWALASDAKYLEEFSNFLNYEMPKIKNVAVSLTSSITTQKSRKSIIKCHSTEKHTYTAPKLKEKKRTLKKSFKKSFNLKRCMRLMPKILPIEIKVLNEPNESNGDTYWCFVDWLAYVTESINSTMQFDNCGILNTLVFHIPQTFYQCFKKRIPSIYEETQTDVLLTYHIMNILHLKEIFDTPQVKLKISKKFVHNEQKGYVEHDENEENGTSYQCPFIFFLNVGQSTVDESDNTNNSFVIEWLPSFSNLTKVGQLKLQYKYGRKST